jgi:Saccharopine dehydrogenase NADP binding domain
MAAEPKVLIAGGYGAFGRILAREVLRTTSARIVIAGRDRERAIEACRHLNAPGRVEAMALDLAQQGSLSDAARGCFAVACTAGPFQRLPASLPLEALTAGAHWLDLADDRAWLLRLLVPRDSPSDALARKRDLAIIPGLSTTPALTGALARLCKEHLPGVSGVSFTLFIGNRNAKGAAAIASLLEGGASAAGFVRTPAGRRLACRISTADAALLRRDLAIDADFGVAFEFLPAGPLICAMSPLLRRIDPALRSRIARVCSALAAPFSSIGRDTGVLQAEFIADDGRRSRLLLIGSGQRIAIAPCAIALEALIDGTMPQRGVVQPAACFPAGEWMRRLACRGLRWASEY